MSSYIRNYNEQNSPEKIKNKLPGISDQFMIFFLSAVTVLLLLGTHIFSLNYITLIISLLFVLYADNDHSLCFIAYLMSFANIFKAAPNTMSFFTVLLLLDVGKRMWIKRSVPVKSVIMTAYLLALQYITGYSDILRTVKLLNNIVLICYVFDEDRNPHMEKVLMCYIIGVTVASYMAFMDSGFFKISQLSITKELGMKYGYGVVKRFSGLDTDPNYYSINVIVSMCVTVVLMHTKYIRPMTAYVLLGSFIVLTVFTYSKSAYLMLCFPVVYLMYSLVRNKKAGLTFLMIGGILMMGFVIMTQFDFAQVITSRFTQDSESGIDGLTTGRTKIWRLYFTFFGENIPYVLFGTGMNAPFPENRAAHNTPIEIIYSIGIVGGVLLVWSLSSKHTLPKSERCILNHSVFVCAFIMYMFLSELFYYDAAFHLIMGKIVFNMNLKQEQTDSNMLKTAAEYQRRCLYVR